MAKDASFDIVSEVNTEEVKNAIQQTTKELTNRFDFKDSTVEIKLENSNLVVLSDDDFKIEQIKDDQKKCANQKYPFFRIGTRARWQSSSNCRSGQRNRSRKREKNHYSYQK